MSTVPQSPELLALADEVTPAEQAEMARVAGVTVEHPAFKTFVGMARHYGLNPLLGEIFLLETDVFDRGTGQWVTELRPGVGRDGFLVIARRDKNVIVPPRSNVVCANDDFSFTDTGREITIEHKVNLTSADRRHLADNPTDEAAIRGPVLGSWAMLYYRDDTPPFFYWAPIEEHGKKRVVGEDGAEATEEWIGAWSYTHAMSAKSSQSYVLRIGAQITGLVPADELRGGASSLTGSLRTAGGGGGRPRETHGAADYETIVKALDVPDEPKAALIAALAEVNRLSPFSWATAKVAIVTDGADEEKVSALIEEINGEIEKLGGDPVKVGA